MPQETPTLEDRELSAQKGARPDSANVSPAGDPDFVDHPDPAKALFGRVLKGQYVIGGVLGQGAMGLVFRGTQRGLEKVVAIKVMHLDGMHTREWRDRFEREATAVSKILHPGITQVLDFGIEGNMPFLVMEFVDGKELTDVLAQEGPMPPARALLIIRQLASALEEAHRNGIVHRDIKPQNLRLMRYTPGGQVFLKVLDFGIAKQLGDAPDKGHLTATGAVMGTPMYMAPEQAGGHKVDFRADQYAVGIVLYELLTGTVPFTGETLTGVLVSHLTKPPPPLPRQVPEPLQKVVMRLLAKSPAERFADMAELDRALAACEDPDRRRGSFGRAGARGRRGDDAAAGTEPLPAARRGGRGRRARAARRGGGARAAPARPKDPRRRSGSRGRPLDPRQAGQSPCPAERPIDWAADRRQPAGGRQRQARVGVSPRPPRKGRGQARPRDRRLAQAAQRDQVRPRRRPLHRRAARDQGAAGRGPEAPR